MNTSSPSTLNSIDEVDEDWLRSALSTSIQNAIPPIDSFTRYAIGAGTVGDTQRVEINYASGPESAPRSVILKFHSSDPQSREQSAQGGVHVREIETYQALAKSGACQTPRLFFASGDETHMNLVLEDLSKVTDPGDQLVGCSIAQAGDVIDQLASLHRYYCPIFSAAKAPWMLSMEDMADNWIDGIRAGAASAADRFQDAFDESAYQQINICAQIADRWYRREAAGLTLTHGDPRVDNVLFDRHDGEAGAYLLDWQLTGQRSAMYDVAYFLTSSLRIEDRRTAEQILLQRYYSGVFDSGLFASEQDAMREYEIHIVANLLLSILSIVALPNTSENTTLIQTLLRRTLAALDDHGGAETLAGRITQ